MCLPSGEVRYIEERCETEFAPDGTPLSSRGSVQDITARIEGEVALRESEWRFRQVLMGMPVLLVAVDDNHQVVLWNRECERVTGYAPEEIIGNPLAWDLLFPDPAHRDTLFADGITERQDVRGRATTLTCKVGIPRVVEWSNISSSVPILGWAFWAVGVDVTDQRQAENARRASEARFHCFFREAPVGLAIFDCDLRYQQVNPVLATMNGVSPEEHIGKSPRQILPPDLWALLEPDLRSVLGTKCPVTDHIMAGSTQAHPNDFRTYSVTAFPIVGDSSQLDGIGGVVFDITALTQAEQQLRGSETLLREQLDQLAVAHAQLNLETTRRQRLEAELANAHRLMSMSALAGGIAHELNQPLTAVLNYVKGCLRRLQPSSAEAGLREPLQEATAEARRAVEIIHTLRDLIRQRPPELRTGDVNEFIAQASNLIQSVARPAGVRIVCTLADALPTLRLDGLLITQAVLNLLSNAIEAMEQVPTDERVVELETAIDDSGAVRVGVSDRGPGLPASVDLAGPLRSTKAGGMGLGLLVTRNLVELHHGRLWAVARPGGGTSFYFTLGISPELLPL